MCSRVAGHDQKQESRAETSCPAVTARDKKKQSSLPIPVWGIALCSSLVLAGCGAGSTASTSSKSVNAPVSTSSPAPITISVGSASVRSGSSVTLTATADGNVLSSGTWSVEGGAANGSIDANGVYLAPTPAPQTGTAAIDFSYQGRTTTTSLNVLNPVPVALSLNPQQLQQSVAGVVTVTGSGFIPASSLLVNGAPVATTFIDASHISASITPGGSSVGVQVVNPAPGSSTSGMLSVSVQAGLLVSPAALPTGDITFTVTRSAGIPSGTVVQVNGTAFATKALSSTTVSATGFIAPWQNGSVMITLANNSSNSASTVDSTSAPLVTTAVSYDAAARFAHQAAFGPRHDVIERIQALGFSKFLDEQMQQPIASYPRNVAPQQSFLVDVAAGNSLLRQRMAWAFQTFIPEEQIFVQATGQPWETTLEADAFGNFKQLLLDSSNTVGVADPLGMAGNAAPTDPSLHPNQNFARELMQLFSMGPVMLNSDGTVQTDATGNPVPSYTEDTVLNLSRALTGWEHAAAKDSYFTVFGVDWSAGYTAVETEHDHSSKTIFGVTMPAGQTAAQDRAQAIDIIFQQPNVPPFISRLLIQRLVKSRPSPSYVARVASVFKDDGSGVRGNLSAVIRAILLDPEARAGDSAQAANDDGFVQDPLYAFTSVMSLMEISGIDTQPVYEPGRLGEAWWQPGTVFGSFSPSYVIPGTAINSPEFQLINTMTVVQRSEALYAIAMHEYWHGFNPNQNSWVDTHFQTLPGMIDAMNHMLYHGQMPQYEQDIITRYCSAQSDAQSQVHCALFLSVNSDNYTVIH